MPTRAETLRGYVQGIHTQWLQTRGREAYGSASVAGLASIDVRYRYNPDVKSLPAVITSYSIHYTKLYESPAGYRSPKRSKTNR